MPAPRMDLAKHVPLPAPLALYVEPTNACNFKCPICPESLSDYQKQAGYYQRMSPFTFERIMSSLKGWTRLKVIRFFWVGEPLLNPALPRMISASQLVADRTELTTNGSKLNHTWNRALIDVRLDYLRISVYGTTDDEYRKETGTFARLEDIRQSVLALKFERNLRGFKTPFIYAELVSSIPGNEARFAQQWEPVADAIGIKPLHNWGSYGEGLVQLGAASKPRNKLVCPFPFYEMMIKANGDVSPCCADWNGKLKLGNVNQESLRSIWQGIGWQNLRASHLMGRRQHIGACRDCNLIYTSPDDMDSLVDSRLTEAGSRATP